MDESSVLGTILHVLFEILVQGLGRWLIDFIWFDEEALVRKLKTAILSIEAMLSCTTQKQIANAAVREWLNELEEAVYDARILVNEVCGESSHGKSGNRARRKEMKRVLDKLEYMAGQKDVLGLRDLEISPICKSPTTSSLQESHVYGRNNDMEAITRLLLSCDEPGDVTSVITVVGDAGIGKTTLVQLVVNDKRIQEQFDLKLWVCVSNGFDAYSVSKEILEAVTMSTCDIRGLGVLQIRLGEELSGKRLLLVLDDVKDENCTEWEIIKGPLRFCSEESKIIVTTCDENIAAMMRTLPAYHLSKLSFKDCWSIFARYALHGNRFVADPELKEIGRGIVKKCKGHPLAAKTIGNLLRYQPNREKWDGILKDELWDSSHDIISVIETLSLKSRRSRGKDSIVERNRGKYVSMKLTMRRHHSMATVRDKLIPVPPMYKAIRSKKSWFPILLTLWIIVWSILSLAVFNATNYHFKIERKELHARMCNQGARALQNHMMAYLDRTYRLALLGLRYWSHPDVCTEEVCNFCPDVDGFVLGYLNSFWGKEWLLSFSRFQGDYPQGLVFLSPLPSTSEKEQAHLLKAAALGEGEIFSAISGPRNKHYGMTKLLFCPPFSGDVQHAFVENTSAFLCHGHFNSSLASRESMIGYVAMLLPLELLVKSTFGFNHTNGSQTIWVNIHLMSNSSSFQAYGQQHFENYEPILYKSKFAYKQGLSGEIICGHHGKFHLTWTTITITMLFFICGTLPGYMIFIIANSIIITGEASSISQELQVQIEAIDAATSHQLDTASHKIATPAYSIQEPLALLLKTELSPTQKGYAKLAQTCTKNLITTAEDALRRSH